MERRKYRKSEILPIFKKRLSFIGWMLREYRWDQFLTLKEAQDLSGIHFRTISRIEHGENVSLITLFRYMDFLGLEMTDIIPIDEELE